MNKKRNIELVIRKVSFAQAEEDDVAYYAQNSWQNSAAIVEEMRKGIWNKVYGLKREKIIFKAGLKEDRDDFE